MSLIIFSIICPLSTLVNNKYFHSKTWSCSGRETENSLPIMEIERRIFPMRIFNFILIEFWNHNQNKNTFHGPDSSLFQAISPIFYIIRIFGLAPYRFSKNRLVSSNANLLFSFLAIFTNTYIIFTILNRILNDSNQRPVLNSTERGKVLFNYSTLMIDILITMLTRNKFVKVWNIIQDFDHQTRDLGFPQTNKKTKFWIWIAVILNSLTWLWINQTGMYAFQESFIVNFSYMFIYVGICYSVIKFSGMIIIIGQRFKHLNKIVRICSSDGRDLIVNSKVEKMMIEKLRDDLMVASEKLNSLNYWTLLLWIFNLSIHAVSGTYFFILWLTHDLGTIDMPIYFCLVGWLVVHVTQLVLLHSSCDFASSEANRMDYTLLNWYRWQSSLNSRRDFESTVHLMNNKLNFSAAGCFHVNLPLLRSITGLLTTYLIILLQLPN